MRFKNAAAIVGAVSIFVTSFSGYAVYAAEGDGIATLDDLKAAFAGTFSGSYSLENNIDVTNSGITSDITIDGNNMVLNSVESTNDSTIYQNENVDSVLENVTINGNEKPEVGIWEGAGSMTLNDVTIQNYSVSTVRMAAIGVGSSGSGKQGNLTLNNVEFLNNSDYDINISDSATVNINEGTELETLRLQSNSCTLNIGENWSGSFEITMDSPWSRTLGTVGDGADISGITVSNEGYYIVNEAGELRIQNDNGAAIYFDMSERGDLHKGSTGFLYGTAEPNVPTIDLLRGLKPSTMVQKALGGLQHPTGDAIRTSSAIEAAGVKNIQVYLQDIYLEWPYNAPYKDDGSLDVDGYTRTCESILYGMICDKAEKDTEGAFLGSDGNYYVLNETEAARYSYVLFNEPDNIWYGNNLNGLKAAWKQVYDAVHKIDPNAKCAGPNYANFDRNEYDNFLSYCYDNNCLPELITWHELGDSSMTSFFSNYDSIKAMADKYYTESYAEKSGRSYQPELLVNEYARHYDIGAPGGLVKWLAMFEDKDIDGCMAYWAMANSLNEMAADQNSPSSTWWVYHWYAQMTGEQCALTSPDFEDTRFYGVTSYDEDIDMAYTIFGGSEEKGGKETVYLNNMSSTGISGANGAANVKVYAVSYSGQLGTEYEPEIIFDGPVNIENDTLKIQVTDTDEMDAFFAVITSTDETGAPMENVSISTLSYEAEDAELIGGARAYDKVGWSTFAASGRKDVGNINNNGDGVRFTVNVPEDGMYDVGLFYSLQAPYVDAQTLEPDANGQNRAIGHTLPYGMQVDDGDVNTIYLESTVVWNYRRHYNTDVYLTEGDHTITFTQINGDEGDKGNLQLVAAIDKLDLDLIESEDTRYDFEIDMSEQTNFKEGNVTKVTAIAPIAGYYNVSGEGGFTLTRQSVDYASDAKTYSDVNVYDVEIGNTVYLSQGANTIGVTGDVGVLNFEYDAVKTEQNSVVIDAEDMAIHGTNAYYKENEYAESGSVVTELGIGQNEEDSANAEDNYIEFNVNAPSEGMYNFAIRYANDEPAPVMLKSDGSTYVHPYNIDLVERYAQISVNGGEPETVYFRNTMSWETFREVDVQLRLSEGDNIIRIYNDNSYQFSELVNSTAPEIDTITVSRQSWDGTSVTVSSEQGVIDTSMLDVVIAEAERKLDQNDVYSETSLNELKAALERVVRDTQSGVNRSYNDVKDAIDALKPISLDLSEYYITSYASTSVGTPSNSFDGDTSTVWTTDRSTSPYVAYEVFYAGDGKVFDLEEIEMQGDTNTKVMYLGTNSDDILKDPVSMGVADQDLCKKDSELYRPFAQLYSADILGTANGADVTTQLSGQYRYLIVAAYVWEVTNVSELTLSATVEDTDGIEADIEIVQDTDGMNAEFNIKYNNTGELPKAYFAGYDETGKLISLDTAQVEGDHLSLELASGAKKYKAFLWDDDQVPLAAAVSYNE